MSNLISRQKVSDIIKTRLYQTALNNDEYITSYDKVCEDIAENRIDTWINEAKSVAPETCGDCISRQAVLNLFAEKCDTVRPYHEVWQAVKELSSVKPEKCGDCISREWLYKECLRIQCDKKERYFDIDDVRKLVVKAPPVEPERKTGEWIWEDGNIPYCSICKKYSDDADIQDIHGEVHYCSHCGAKMEVKE